MRVDLEEHAGRWLCAWCRKLAETRASLARPLRTLAVGLVALGLAACKPPDTWLAELNLYPDAPTCSYAGRDCQTHWLICAGGCERTTTGVDLIAADRPLRTSETCASYRRVARRLCADVRTETFNTAICSDYAEGWCDEIVCNPKPAGCN